MNESDAETFLPLRPSHFHILLTLCGADVHGYGIRQQVEARTEGRIVLAAGTLYETLARLERDGLIEETSAPTDASPRAGKRWRFYAATRLGREVMRLEVLRLEADVSVARTVILGNADG
ncbi:MAG: PadR family transcriptional regulator [Gemmatimonadota bacterium]